MRPDEKLQAALMLIVLVLGILSTAPIILGERIVEPFSELGVLGPEMKLGDYPNQVETGESMDLYLYLGNHEGTLQYYRVYAKQGDQSVNISDTEAYPEPVITHFDYVLTDEANITMPINLVLETPGVNQRIVFELHKYNPQTDQFLYDGIWVQLWMNITAPQ